MRVQPKRLVFFSAALLVAWVTAVASYIVAKGNRDQARQSDCIIVLGAAAYHDRPSPVYEERIRHAISLYEQGLAPRIVFTGGYGTGAAHAESTVGARYAQARGVPESATLTETVSRTTRQNLEEAKAVMDTHGLQSAIIVSDPLHLSRAAIMARRVGISAVTSPTPTSRYRSVRARMGFLAREIYFFHHFFVTGA